MTDAAPAGIDHVVVNVMRGMAEAAATFAALGFELTPLGRHSFGSVNHLMMTPGAYLELVGVPEEGPQRQEVLDSPFGLSGLVFRSDDADATFARLAEAGLSPSRPVAFSRPVTIGGEAREARFRTVLLPGDLFPAGRVYFCEHLTPELVWRDEWLRHPNGFVGIDRIEIASPDVSRDAGRYAAAAGARIEGRSVPLSGFRIEFAEGDRERFSSLGLVFDGLERLASFAEKAAGVEWRRLDERTGRIEIAALRLKIDCRSAS